MAPHHFPHTLEPLFVAVQKINIKLCLSFTDTLTPRNLRLGFLRSGSLAVSEQQLTSTVLLSGCSSRESVASLKNLFDAG